MKKKNINLLPRLYKCCVVQEKSVFIYFLFFIN